MINPEFTKSIDQRFRKRITSLVFKYFFQTKIKPHPIRLKELLAKLDTEDIQQLCDVVFSLGDFGNRSAIVPLAKMYYDHTWNEKSQLKFLSPDSVRTAIAIALYNLGESEELKDILFSESGSPRTWMVTILKNLDGDQVNNCLTKALKSRDDTLVYWAASTLGECGDKRAVESLIDILAHSYIDVRVTAAESLGKIGDDKALRALELMRNTDHAKNWSNRKASQVADDAITKIKERPHNPALS